MWTSVHVEEIFKTIIRAEGKERKNKQNFLRFNETDKMLTPVHQDKSWIYNVILRATPKKPILRGTLKSTRDISKWNSQICLSNPQESITKKTGRQITEKMK